MFVGGKEMKMISKPIEDVIKDEIDNCIQYDPYKVCIVTSNKDEAVHIASLVHNMFKNMNLEKYREECGGLYFYPKGKMSIGIWVRDIDYMKKEMVCGMRFTTIIFCNPDESLCDDYRLIKMKCNTLPLPGHKYGDNICGINYDIKE